MRAGLGEIYPRLWRFALSLTGDTDRAADLAQSTALRAIEQADKFQPGTHLDRWLFVMARRLWLNDMRSAKLRPVADPDALEEDRLAAPLPAPETNIFAREVFEKVMELKQEQRVTVVLVYVEGYTYQEAADMLDVPIGTVMSRLATARKKLQKATGDQKASAR
ncbi:MAG: RNA polymerase sigma factor [Pseudomonadota bacterium]